MADPNFLHIRNESLEEAQTDLAAAYAAARNAIDELRSKLDDKLGDWSGDAQAAYLDERGKWDATFDRMAAVLKQAHVHIGSAQEMYNAVERQNLSIWHG
jgi:WXG100 family type VII secretion target